MKKTIEKDGYPWLNLVDLNKEKQIWYKYGIGRQGGAIFMVNSEGTIIAINPEPEEVISLLEERK